jgi:oligopeptide transport system ATP-binding protein
MPRFRRIYETQKTGGTFVRAVDGVSFSIKKSEIFALVGESGCGKTTTAKMIVGLVKPTSGSVAFLGHELTDLGSRAMRPFRKDIQMVFQDPYSSLDPRMTVEQVISEPLNAFGYSRSDRLTIVRELLNDVGLRPESAAKYPKEFSGGQKQRIGIARALALGPKLIVADEPVSALDISVRAQILKILLNLREKRGISILIIAHDLSIVRHVADRVAVMHLGKIVELSDNEGFFENTLHPYSQALLDAIPIPDPSVTPKRNVPKGELPDPINPPAGCRFHTRCSKRFEPCDQVEPELLKYSDNHSVACHLFDEQLLTKS